MVNYIDKNNVKSNEIRSLHLNTLNITAYSIALLIFVYSICSTPFVSTSYLPKTIRAALEGAVIASTFIVNTYYNKSKYIYVFLGFITFLFACIPFFGPEAFIDIISYYNKMIVFILIIGVLLSSNAIYNITLMLWVNLFRLICCLAIIAFVGFVTNTVPFTFLDFSQINSEAPYLYIHNTLLGNLVPKNFSGTVVGRVSSFMYEPGYIGYFFGFNIVASRSLIKDKMSRRIFVILNFLAGLTTISLSFVLIILFITLTKHLLQDNKKSLHVRVIFIAIVLSLITLSVCQLVLSGYLGDFLENASSMATRINRLDLAYDIFTNNSFLTLLFGNGVNFSSVYGNMGISAGLINIFIERGLIMSFFIIFLFITVTKHDSWILFYVFLYSLTFEMFWSPLFLLGIAVVYANSKRLVHNSVQV